MSLFFCTEVRHHFDSLAKQFGLICQSVTERCVRYENDKVFLLINYDGNRSYELGVEIGQRNTEYSGPPFSLSEILRYKGVNDTVSVSDLMVSDQSQLPHILSKLAKLTVDYVSDFLNGNEFSFAQITKFRNKESFEFELASRLRFARLDVDIAWPLKNYKAVVKVLEPLEPYLSEAEKKKLVFSRKRLSDS